MHVEIVGSDATQLREFYGSAFGWEFGAPSRGANTQDYRMTGEADGGSVTAGIGGDVEGYGGHVTFYISVPDLEAALATVERLGGTTMMAPTRVPDGPRIALFHDPEGHMVGLVQLDAA
ncbi:MAG TPA: VOC family protein [Candidatus Elarobacter sp.]